MKPVFFDPSRKREKRVIRFVGLIIFIIILATIVLTASGVFSPILPLPKKFTEAELSHKLHAVIKPNIKCLKGQCEKDFQNTVSLRRSATDAINMSAFFVEWDDASTASLHENLGKVDTLVTEELTLIETGVTLIQPDRFQKTIGYIRTHREDVRIVPLINNYSETKNLWDGNLVYRILSDTARRNQLEESILSFIDTNNLDGINIDFEDLPKETMSSYYDFLSELSGKLHTQHLTLSANTPFDNDNFDLPRIASYCDDIILMAYDEHWSGGIPGPVSGLDWYEKRLTDILKTVPKDKIQIALGNYGYDWEKTGSGVAVTFQDAQTTARESDTTISFDSGSLNPYFSYDDENNKNHTVWYLDAITSYNQVMIAQNLGVDNFILWRMGSEDPSFWKLFDTKHLEQDIKPTELEDFSYGYSIDYEGSGELYRVTRTPSDGHRDITYDSGLVTDESITKFPLSYEISRYGWSGKKEVALTFDDGPDPNSTPAILDILKKYQTPATFFIVGNQGQRYPYILQREYDEGHLIGNHSFTHPDISKTGIVRDHLELNLTERMIESITGHMSLLFRPPYAEDIEPELPEEVPPLVMSRDLGYITVGMKIDPNDWQSPGVDTIVDRVVAQAKAGNGNIVLLHDAGGDRTQTIAALPKIIETLRANGFTIVPLSVLASESRDTLMPSSSGGESALKLGDSVIFWLTFGISWCVYVAFFFGMFVALFRFSIVIALAIVQRMKEKKRTFHDLPTVSVIVPAYNEGIVIKKTLESIVMSQGVIPEVIVVDDGSTDDTLALATSIAATLPGVSVYTKENGGKGSAINYGIEKSTGEIIVVMDADTIFDKHTLVRLLSHFHDPEIAAVSGNVKVGNRNKLITRIQAIEYITMQNLERRAYEMLNAITVVPGAVGAWRKSAILEVGGFSPNTLAEDSDLTFAILRRGHKVIHDHDAIAYTEAPEDWKSLNKQRFRWIFGILQVTYKHRSIMFDAHVSAALRFFIIPYLFLFQIILPLILPVIDLSLIFSIGLSVVDHWLYGSLEYLYLLRKMLLYFAIFFSFDLLVGVLAFSLEKGEQKSLLWYLPIQKITFRFFLYYIQLKALWYSITGKGTGWNKLERTNSVK